MPESNHALTAEALDAGTAQTLRRMREHARATARTPVDPPPPVVALVLTRNRPEMLRRALDSIRQSPAVRLTLVLDNASDPQAAAAVTAECQGRDDVRLLRSEENLGSAGGRIRLVDESEGELVLFLDDDAELLPGALEHMLIELQADPLAAAVTATVVAPDGLVLHSGGSLELGGGLANFALVGEGLAFDDPSIPASGPAGWVPGTAALIRRELLQEFPLDESMAAYHEDNKWGYSVAQGRPGSFRRSREALVLHHLSPIATNGRGSSYTPEQLIALLAVHARFYEQHGVLMGPWVLGLLPGLQAGDGTSEPADIRLLLELMNAKGGDWMLEAYRSGALDGLINAHARQHALTDTAAALERTRREADAERARLTGVIEEKEQTAIYLHGRHETLRRIEAGGWWRLHGRLQPLLELAAELRRRLRR